jgi:hypothetical protein
MTMMTQHLLCMEEKEESHGKIDQFTSSPSLPLFLLVPEISLLPLKSSRVTQTLSQT